VRAEAAGVATRAFPVDRRGDATRGGTAPTAFPDRVARDEAMAAWLVEHGVELVVLAGYMQLLNPVFLDRFPLRVINVHPALLPAFPGIGAVEQALAHGVKVFGVTVHFVDEGVDTGAIIFQRAIEVGDLTDPDDLHDRLRPLEHELLPEAVRRFAAGEVAIDPVNHRRVVVG